MLQLQKVVGVRPKTNMSEDASLVKVKQEPNVNFTDDCEEAESDAYYVAPEEVNYSNRGYTTRARYAGPRRGGRQGRSRGSAPRGNNYFRGRGNSKKTNPVGPDGSTSTCRICGSYMHWARNCPHKEAEDSYKESTHEAYVVLLNIEDSTSGDSSILGQTIGSMILDSGCAKSVCGQDWYDCYMETLSVEDKRKLHPKKSESVFRFGNGAELKSKFNIDIPCSVAGKNVYVNTDVIDSTIPLLLSKSAMKKAECMLNFKEDTVSIFGRTVRLECTESGHYYIPLNRPGKIDGKECEILFMRNFQEKSAEEKKKVAKKLHQQFSHPTSEKLISLVKSSGMKDADFLNMIAEVTGKCGRQAQRVTSTTH